MILQSLVRYYEALAEEEKVTRQGWCMAKVSFALDISEDGELLRILSLKISETRGKKEVWIPQNIKVPQMVSRSSGISPNFLCDHSGYLLGIDNKGKPKRSIECFSSARDKHLKILEGVKSKAAAAVVRFFQTWEPQEAAGHPALLEILDEITAGGNLVFSVGGEYVHEDYEIRQAWQIYGDQKEKGEEGTCLVTGQKAEIARTHTTIKGVQGAQSSGAALVSFNAPAFESYGKEQSFNAPVGIYAVYAYTTALNYLLNHKNHVTVLGDTTIVYWAESGKEVYQKVFSSVSEPTMDNQELVDGVFKNLASGKAVVADQVGEEVSMEQRFYILGLSPNAARIAVRFFYQDSFGNILCHIKEHYDRMRIVRPAMDKTEYLGIWRMLMETVNKKSREKKPSANMAGSVYRSVIAGTPYPNSLYQAVLGRIRAEQDNKDAHIYKITRGRVSIIKAFLLKNVGRNEEEITMGLNEDCRDTAYILGREFAVLEEIQEAANKEMNATIKDRYFNAACATPASIFPILFKLKNSHIRKLHNKGLEIYYEKMLCHLQEMLEVNAGYQTAGPRRLNLEEQGMFILGYYHQTQKRYEKVKKEQQEEK